MGLHAHQISVFIRVFSNQNSPYYCLLSSCYFKALLITEDKERSEQVLCVLESLAEQVIQSLKKIHQIL